MMKRKDKKLSPKNRPVTYNKNHKPGDPVIGWKRISRKGAPVRVNQIILSDETARALGMEEKWRGGHGS